MNTESAKTDLAARAPTAAAIEEVCKSRQDKEDALAFAQDKLDNMYAVLEYVHDDLDFLANGSKLPEEIRGKLKAAWRGVNLAGCQIFDAARMVDEAVGEGDETPSESAARAH